jgi:hypothetical protein
MLVVHRVEGGDRPYVGRSQLEHVGDLLHVRGRDPAVELLGVAEEGEKRRPFRRIAAQDRLEPLAGLNAVEQRRIRIALRQLEGLGSGHGGV